MTLARHYHVDDGTSRKDRCGRPDRSMAYQIDALNLPTGHRHGDFSARCVGELPGPPRDWLLTQPIDVKTLSARPLLRHRRGVGASGDGTVGAGSGDLRRSYRNRHCLPRTQVFFRAAAGWGWPRSRRIDRRREALLGTSPGRPGEYLTRRAERGERGVCWHHGMDASLSRFSHWAAAG